ncbi:HAMP domain-containing histidine kinase [Patescibacteria group bacterium]|nr:HAMP domain-containing histidine kinase [Patescibacteria group bacterium]
MICYFYPEPTYLVYATDLPPLLYYSHIPAMVMALIVGVFVFLNGREFLLNRLLLAISVCFSLWTVANLIAWTNIHSDFILFIWSFFGLLSGLISIFCIYFIYAFLQKGDVSLRIKSIFLGLLAPILVLAPTTLNLAGFNISACDAFGYENIYFQIYYTSLGVLAMVWILILLIRSHATASIDFKKQIVLMGIGIEFFLFSFFTMGFLASYLTGIGVLPDSQLEMYGLFGMAVFMVYIAVLMVRFKTFHAGILAAQALVVALLILVGSQLTFVRSTTNVVLTIVALILTALMGTYLIRSVQRETAQRKRIEKLATDLSEANGRLKQLDQLKSEFLSVASHQLRAPITAIRGYTSNIIDGSYGSVPTYIVDPLKVIYESSRLMASSIEDYLNISRIEQGRMKYEKSEFDVSDLTHRVVNELEPVATAKGLKLLFSTSGPAKITADIGKMKQVITNLIDNAIKYTTEGSVSVGVTIAGPVVRMTVKDTGVGINADDIEKLFSKFTRARDANSVNTTGTGLGLYVAKQLTEGNGGKVWVESEGVGKGATFIVEMPV